MPTDIIGLIEDYSRSFLDNHCIYLGVQIPTKGANGRTTWVDDPKMPDNTKDMQCIGICNEQGLCNSSFTIEFWIKFEKLAKLQSDNVYIAEEWAMRTFDAKGDDNRDVTHYRPLLTTEKIAEHEVFLNLGFLEYNPLNQELLNDNDINGNNNKEQELKQNTNVNNNENSSSGNTCHVLLPCFGMTTDDYIQVANKTENLQSKQRVTFVDVLRQQNKLKWFPKKIDNNNSNKKSKKNKNKKKNKNIINFNKNKSKYKNSNTIESNNYSSSSSYNSNHKSNSKTDNLNNINNASFIMHNEWNHVAFVYDIEKERKTTYINGCEYYKCDKVKAIKRNRQGLMVGYCDGHSPHAWISELRVWGLARNENEINQYMYKFGMYFDDLKIETLCKYDKLNSCYTMKQFGNVYDCVEKMKRKSIRHSKSNYANYVLQNVINDERYIQEMVDT